MKWVILILLVGIAIYIYRQKQDQIFDGHRLDKDLKKWKDYKHKMRVLAKEKEGVYRASLDSYKNQYSYREDNEGDFDNVRDKEIEEILSVEEMIAGADDIKNDTNNNPNRSKQVIKKKRWRWKGWRR